MWGNAGVGRRITARMLATTMLVLAGTLAFAADLATAKRDGLIGEREDGYIGIVQTDASADVRKLVADVNAKRRSRYQAIADENRIALSVVEERAGRTAITRTQDGLFIRSGGRWVRK